MKRLLLIGYCWCIMTACVMAQRHEILLPHIASLQVVAGDDWMSMPVISLDGHTPIHISFDDLTHEYHRYSYRLEHCEADWTVSDQLFESDYCVGFASGNTIDDFRESQGTNELYTHYHLQIPNDRCRPKMSGNYKLTVIDEHHDDQPILVACFMVVEPLMRTGLAVTTKTDRDIDGRHQQVEMRVDYGSLRVTSPEAQITTVVMQNGCWHNAVVNARPQMVTGDGLTWSHCRDLIFDGGNEYRKFEMLDVTHTTLGLEDMSWDGTRYHADVWPDEARPSYVYDEDANGAYYLRNSDNIGNDTRSEYILTHFTLRSPHLPGPVYLNGAWTYDRFTPPYLMTWNEERQQYEGEVWLKQGYYNYRYLQQQPDGSYTGVPSEGNFYQTRNSYQALIYYKGIGERADRLVSYATIE